jgi:hypothetical protein
MRQHAAVRPVTIAAHRVVEVDGALAPLFPEGGLRRGSTIAVGGAGTSSGATTLALGLVARASRQGSWCAAVGMPSLGLVAAGELGVSLDRLALVPEPGPQWPTVVAALLDAVELVLMAPPDRVRPADARRLGARVRERGAVLVVMQQAIRWPERVELALDVATGSWRGLGDGHGLLEARQAEVVASGRGAAARPRRARLWLPGADGTLAAAGPFGWGTGAGAADGWGAGAGAADRAADGQDAPPRVALVG